MANYARRMQRARAHSSLSTRIVTSVKTVVAPDILDPTQIGGIDTDFYAGPMNFDFAKLAGVNFAVVRMGQGFYGTDPQFHASWANVKGVLKRDTYWFLDPQQSANGQARQVASLLGSDFDPETIVWADFECATTIKQKGQKPFHIDASFLFGFLATLEAMIPTVKLGIYTGYSYWSQWGSRDPKFGKYPLWISWPPFQMRPGLVPAPLAPFNGWLYWQWSFAGDGRRYGASSRGIDLNYMNKQSSM